MAKKLTTLIAAACIALAASIASSIGSTRVTNAAASPAGQVSELVERAGDLPVAGKTIEGLTRPH